MSALFKDPADDYRLRVKVVDVAGVEVPGFITLIECQRCKLWTANTGGHTAWHQSVDTGQTAELAR